MFIIYKYLYSDYIFHIVTYTFFWHCEKLIACAQKDGLLGPKYVVGKAMADAGKAAMSQTGV